MAKRIPRKRDEDMTAEELEKARKNRARAAAWLAKPGNKERSRTRTKAWGATPENKAHKKRRQEERRQERLADPVEAAKIRERGRMNAGQYRKKPKNRDRVRDSNKKQDAKPQRKEKKKEHNHRKYHDNESVREARKAYQIRYYRENPQYRLKVIARATAFNSSDEGKARRGERFRERYRSDPEFRFVVTIRRQMGRAFRGTLKPDSTYALLGCDRVTAMRSIEAMFLPGMTWDNYGDWHIDHIYPLSKVDQTDRLAVRASCHIDNLQPLWGPENSEKHAKVLPEAKKLFGLIVDGLRQQETNGETGP
jgi:hypothetical protein